MELQLIATHLLPNHPPRKHEQCPAFRTLCSHLIAWDQLHAHRTGEEYMFKNYHSESLIGPELAMSVYPRTFYCWIPTSVQDAKFPCDPQKPPPEISSEISTGNHQSKASEDHERILNPTHETHLGRSQPMDLSRLLLNPIQKSSIEENKLHNQYKAGSQPVYYFTDSVSSSLPDLNLKRSLRLIESHIKPGNNFKRQKIALN